MMIPKGSEFLMVPVLQIEAKDIILNISLIIFTYIEKEEYMANIHKIQEFSGI